MKNTKKLLSSQLKKFFDDMLSLEGYDLNLSKISRDYWRSSFGSDSDVAKIWGTFNLFRDDVLGDIYEHVKFKKKVVHIYKKLYEENIDKFESDIPPLELFKVGRYGLTVSIIKRCRLTVEDIHTMAIKDRKFLKIVNSKPKPVKKITREDIYVVKSDQNNDKPKRYFISSILPEAFLDTKFFESILNYCRITKAELVILPMRGIHHTHKHYSEEVMAVADKFVTEYYVNDNLKVLEAQIPPMSPDPISLSMRLAKSTSLIVASPKQDFKALPVLDVNKPWSIWTTGVLTTRAYPKTASGFKGEIETVLGGLILEVDPKTNRFYCRQVQANEDGSFYDLDKCYSASSVTQASAEYLYVGDVHSGFTMGYARKASVEMANRLKVKNVGGGDWLDSYSISHHHKNKIKTKVLKQERQDRKHVSTLEMELRSLAEELKLWLDSLHPDISIDIIKSNHDEHLDRYLEEQRWIDDPINFRISLDLAGAYLDGKNPIRYWIEKNYPELQQRINWLERDTIKRVSAKDILVSQHGDIGPNGSRSTNKNAEWSLQECVLGHSHSPSVTRIVKRVGTLALDLEYIVGASSHQVVNCLVYYNGNYQMLWVGSDGKWHL